MARCEVFLVVALLCGLASTNVVPEGSDVRRSRSTSVADGTVSKKKCVEYSSFVTSAGDGSPRCPGDESTSLKGDDKPKPREFPHVALVGYGEKANITWLCGGTLISPRFVLTAAQCLSAPKQGVPRWVRVGDINIKETTDGVVPQEAAVLERIPHPDYKQRLRNYDIGLLKLEKDLDLNEFVRPACLHTTFDIGQSEAIASGWGRRNDRYSTGDDLMKVKLPIQTTEYCNSSLQGNIVGESMICAGDGERFQDPCHGIYSGYPLQLLKKEPNCMYDIIGITSFGKGSCAEALGGYTRVSHYVPWIEKIVWPEEV